MNRINRVAVGLLPLVLLGTVCSTAALASGSAGGANSGSAGGLAGGVGSASAGERAALRPDADAIPTTVAPPTVPAAPTTAPPGLPTAPPTAPPATVPQTYVPLEDDTGMLSVEVPASWVDVDTRPFINDDGTLRPGISASTDLLSFNDTWDAPGLVYTAFQFQPDPNVLFGRYDYSRSCTDGGTVPYNDQVFVGYVRTFTNCADVGSQNYVIVANPPGNVVTIVLVVQVLTAEDAVAYQHVLETFNIDPNVGMPTETVPPPTTSTTTPLPTVPLPTVPLPTAPPGPAPGPTAPGPTAAPVPTAVPLPTSPLLTTPPQTAPVPTAAPPTAPGPTAPGPTVTGVPTVPVATVPVPTSGGFQTISDDTGRLSIQVPTTWIDVDGTPASEDGVDMAALSAAPNLQVFRDTFGGPGLIFHETAYAADPAVELAARGLAEGCTDGGIQPNPNPNFTGGYQSWLDCEGTKTDLHVLVANPIDGRQVTVVIVVQTLTPADEAALQAALTTYALNPTA